MAARRPAPGGGASAAWTCAFAAALTEMSAAFTRGDGPGGGGTAVEARAQQLRRSALELAERELDSYAPVLEAMRSQPGPGRRQSIQAALSDAAEAPLAIARRAAEVAELGLVALRNGRDQLRGDAVTGILLAEAACASAVQLVELNLSGVADDVRRTEVRRLAERAFAARCAALQARS